MNRRLVLFFALAFGVSLAPSSARAQSHSGPPPQPPSPEQIIQVLKREVGITKDQADAVRAVFQAERASIQAQILSILTPDQQDKYAEFQKDHPPSAGQACRDVRNQAASCHPS
jgi:hypothetical protein